jgi:hypothetical protein
VSKCIYRNGGGVAISLSRDHKPGDEREIKRITDNGG